MPTVKLILSQADIVNFLARQYEVEPKDIDVRVWGPDRDGHMCSPGGFEISISKPNMAKHLLFA